MNVSLGDKFKGCLSGAIYTVESLETTGVVLRLGDATPFVPFDVLAKNYTPVEKGAEEAPKEEAPKEAGPNQVWRYCDGSEWLTSSARTNNDGWRSTCITQGKEFNRDHIGTVPARPSTTWWAFIRQCHAPSEHRNVVLAEEEITKRQDKLNKVYNLEQQERRHHEAIKAAMMGGDRMLWGRFPLVSGYNRRGGR